MTVITAATVLMLAGDVMLGRGIDQIMPHSVDPILYEKFVRSAKEYVTLAEEKSGPIPRNVAPSYVWGEALSIVQRFKPAARIINLETAVTTADKPWPGRGINYRMHPANVVILNAGGITFANLANNHVLDWGRNGLTETLKTLQNAGVKFAGAGVDLMSAAAPAVIAIPGGRVLIFSMADGSSGVPDSWAAGRSRSGVNLLPDLSPSTALGIAQQIKREPRRAGDRVIVSIHWGGNWGYAISGEEERFAKTLIEEGGVDIVHGHSSHHPRRIEVYRERLILYGAGDLINDYEGIGGYEEFRPELSLIYLPALAPSGRFESLTLIPMRMQRFRLNRATAEEAAWLRALLARESRGLKFEMTPDGLIKADASEAGPHS